MAYRKFSRRPRRKIFRRKVSRRSRVSKQVKRYVSKAIHRQIENKRYNIYAANQGVFCPVSNNPCYYASIMPAPGQGTANGQRIGDKIRLMTGRLDWSATYNAYNATSNPYTKYYLTLCVLQTIQHNDSTMATQDWTDFFDAGTSTANWQSTALDTLLKLNENRFRIFYKKTILMGSNTFSSANNQSLGNKFVENCRGSCRLVTKKMKHIVRFDDTSITAPSNTNLFLLAWASPSDATASGNSSIIPVNISYTANFQYEDA